MTHLHNLETYNKLESKIGECLESDLEMEFDKKSENLKKIMDRLYDKIKHAVVNDDIVKSQNNNEQGQKK